MYISQSAFKHVRGRRHQKFANTDANFLQLDYALGRVRRPTREEIQQKEREMEDQKARLLERSLHDAKYTSLLDVKDDNATLPQQGLSEENEVMIGDEEQNYIYLDDDDDY